MSGCEPRGTQSSCYHVGEGDAQVLWKGWYYWDRCTVTILLYYPSLFVVLSGLVVFHLYEVQRRCILLCYIIDIQYYIVTTKVHSAGMLWQCLFHWVWKRMRAAGLLPASSRVFPPSCWSLTQYQSSRLLKIIKLPIQPCNVASQLSVIPDGR